jgi:hypothetical protein
VAPVVGIVGTGRRGEARGQSSGAQLGRRGGRGDGRDAATWKRRVDKRAWMIGGTRGNDFSNYFKDSKSKLV